MKKLVLLSFAALAFCLTSSTVSAQGISVELGLSYNSPGGDFADVYAGGVGFSLHPRYKLSDKMAVGLLIGADAFASGDLISGGSGSGTSTSIGAAGIGSILGTVQYKLLDRKITPYGELGVGMYNYKAGTVDSGTVLSGSGGATEDKSYFGFAPKVGAMVGFLNVYAAYVAAGDLKYTQFGLGFRFGKK